RLIAVARKETLHLVRDWRSLTLALAIPLILILLYGYALTLDLRLVPTVVWDQSRTPESRELLSLFQSSPYFAIKDYKDDYRALQRELDRGNAMVALVIPGNFAAKVQANKPVKIQIIGDGSDANTSRLAMGYAANIGTIYALKVTSEQMQFKGQGELEQPIELIQRAWYNPGLRSQNVLIPGIIALVMIVVAALL
ncbi:MAG: ABC transporter permease, partial [Planctomycetes bacterium]|nr:ABC transporter permease [Planctomycetota bacterium]